MEIVSHHHKSANGTSINCLKQSREAPLRFWFRSSEKRSAYVFDSTRLNWWAVIACSLFAIEMCEVTCFAAVKRPCSRMYSWALRGLFSLHRVLHRLHFQGRNQMLRSGSNPSNGKRYFTGSHLGYLVAWCQDGVSDFQLVCLGVLQGSDKSLYL